MLKEKLIQIGGLAKWVGLLLEISKNELLLMHTREKVSSLIFKAFTVDSMRFSFQ